ncbi:sugar ABC transporter permease [Sphingomonas oleivorans]|uniref:Sugar ABC transporter permease n=1 Tax=Sphingomonas oleivorans TaxID=1735121 RepID=A0A2T5FVJ5_9SPHN|nr:sugar ABC transporter permease [Sphingomonas oleivorans]PTQ09797.1 sugar ABC transporter permease [Sphingomonas oleivorans]
MTYPILMHHLHNGSVQSGQPRRDSHVRSRMRSMLQDRNFVAIAMSCPALVYLALFLLFPLILVIYNSFYHYDLIDPGSRQFDGLDNYVRAIGSHRFWMAVGNSLLFTAVVVCVEFVLGFAVALFIDRLKRGREIVRTILLLPLMIAPIIAAVAWRYIYSSEFGILNWALYQIGLIDSPSALPWLSSPAFALPAAMIVDIWLTTPFIVLILLAGLQALPKSLSDAAKIDGTSLVREIFLIKLPLLRPVIAVALVMRLIDAARTFDAIWILTGGGPRFSSEVLSTQIYRTLARYADVGFSSAIAVLFTVGLMILALCVYLILRPSDAGGRA